jgi:hypothetical protein
LHDDDEQGDEEGWKRSQTSHGIVKETEHHLDAQDVSDAIVNDRLVQHARGDGEHHHGIPLRVRIVVELAEEGEETHERR